MGVMNFAGPLTERLELRIDGESKAELERLAAKLDRKPGALARKFIRDGLRAATQEEQQ